jgi:hypothetical protein
MMAAGADMNTYRADYDTWAEGSAIKIAMHAFVGSLTAKLGGGDAFSGGLGAGAAEYSRSMTENLPKDLQQWASVIIGGATAKLAGGNTNDAMTGAATALDGEKYNRQLHQSELQKIKELANGDKEQYELLLQAACAKVHCADQIPDSDPYKEQALAYQQGGEKLTAQLDILKGVERQDRENQNIHMGLPDEYNLQPKQESKPGDVLFGYDGVDYLQDKLSANPRFGGGIQAIGGGFQLGFAVEAAPACASIIGCGAVITTGYLGVDNIKTGLKSAWDNKYYATDFNNTLQFMGIPQEWADRVELGANVLAPTAAMTTGTKMLGTAEKMVGSEANTITSTGKELTIYDPKFAARQLLQDGTIPESRLQLMVRDGAQNEFLPSDKILFGEKYNYTINDTKVEIKWHSEDLKAADLYPGSNSGSGWTAQIKLDGKLLGQDGSFYKYPDNITHIPVTGVK